MNWCSEDTALEGSCQGKELSSSPMAGPFSLAPALFCHWAGELNWQGGKNAFICFVGSIIALFRSSEHHCCWWWDHLWWRLAVSLARLWGEFVACRCTVWLVSCALSCWWFPRPAAEETAACGWACWIRGRQLVRYWGGWEKLLRALKIGVIHSARKWWSWFKMMPNYSLPGLVSF